MRHLDMSQQSFLTSMSATILSDTTTTTTTTVTTPHVTVHIIFNFKTAFSRKMIIKFDETMRFVFFVQIFIVCWGLRWVQGFSRARPSIFKFLTRSSKCSRALTMTTFRMVKRRTIICSLFLPTRWIIRFA